MVRLLSAVALLAAVPAHAETRRFYDQYGMSTGRAESSGRTTRFYDSRGLPTGRAEDNGHGTVRHYDAQGHPAGSSAR